MKGLRKLRISTDVGRVFNKQLGIHFNIYIMATVNTDLTKKEWNRLLSVTPKEKKKALDCLSRWVTWEIKKRGFDTERGPFSFSAMGGSPVLMIVEECYEALFCGEWRWKEGRTLSSMLIEIAKSKMGHIVRDYYNAGEPEITLVSQQNHRQQVEMEAAYQWELEANMRELGYDIARDVVRGNKTLMAYIDALYEENDYAGIAKRLHVSKRDAMELERQLLEILEQRTVLQI